MMGEASRRGTYEQRKTKAVIRNKERINTTLEVFEKKDANLTLEERNQRTKARLSILSFMAYAKQSGVSLKEFRRRLRRNNKKCV